MNGNQLIEYWDTCIFLAYINKEMHHGNGIYEEIDLHINLFEQGKLRLCTSTITIAEIHAVARFDESNREILKGIFSRSNFFFMDANRMVCNLASDIRSHFKNNPINGCWPTTPDALHVASAIAIKDAIGDEEEYLKLLTLDSNNKIKKNELAFISMSDYIERTYAVKIEKPTLPGLFAKNGQ